MKQFLHAVVVLLFCLQYAYPIPQQLGAPFNTIQVVNGVQRPVTQVGFSAGPADINTPFTYEVLDPVTSALLADVTLNLKQPKKIYSMAPSFQVPLAAYPFVNKICTVAYSTPLNSEAVQAETQAPGNGVVTMERRNRYSLQKKSHERGLKQLDPVAWAALGLAIANRQAINGLQDDVRKIGMDITAINNSLNILDAWSVKIDTFQNQTIGFENQTFKEVLGLSTGLGQQIATTTLIQQNLNSTNQFVANFYASATTEFSNLENGENQLFNITDALYQYITNVSTATKASLLSLLNNIVALSNSDDNFKIQTYYNLRNVDIRRALIALVQEHLFDADPLESIPFVRSVGFPPLTYNEKVALSNLQNATALTTVHFLYTATQGGAEYATDMAITLIADTDWALNNTVPNVAINYIMANIGPPSCNTGTSPWACQVLLSVQTTSCRLTSANVQFPYAWNSTILLSASPQINTLCTGTLQTSGTIQYDSLTTWYSFFKAWVITTAFVHGPTPNNYDLRITSEQFAQYIDLAIGTNAVLLSNPDYLAPSTDLNAALLPSYSLYRFIETGYQNTLPTLLENKEVQIYGQFVSDVESGIDGLFNQQPNINQTYTCYYAKYTRVSTMIQTAYLITPIGMQTEVDVTINNHPTQTINDSLSVPSNVSGLNISVAVTTSFSSSFDFLLPSATTSINYIFGDPTSTGVVFDNAPDDISNAVRIEARCGKVNYIARDYLSDAPFNLLDYMEEYAISEWDPSCVKSSLIDHARVWAPITLGSSQYVCGNQIPQTFDLGSTQANALNSQWFCQAAQQFQIETSASAGTLSFGYLSDFSVNFVITAPAGVFTDVLLSQCPTSYAVYVIPSVGTIVQFNTTVVDPLVLTVQVSSDNPDCTNLYTNQPQHYSASSPLNVQIAPCGNMYINVFTYGSTSGCYLGSGLNMQVNSQPTRSSLVTSQIQDYTQLIQDSTYTTLLKQLQASETFTTQLILLSRQQVNSSYFNQALAELQADKAAAQNNTWNGITGNATAQLDAFVASQTANNAMISASIAAENDTINAVNAALAISAQIILDQVQTLNQSFALQAQFNASLAKILKLDFSSGGFGFDFLSGLGSLIGVVADDAVGLFTGIVKAVAGIPGDILGGLLGAASGLLTLLAFILAGISLLACGYLWRQIQNLNAALIARSGGGGAESALLLGTILGNKHANRDDEHTGEGYSDEEHDQMEKEHMKSKKNKFSDFVHIGRKKETE